MVKQLIKRGYFKIVPFEETSFFKTALPGETKLTKELIELNYRSYAPYNTPFIVSYQEKGQLYIWYMQKDADAFVVIPESFLLYLHFKQRLSDAIIIIEDEQIKKVLVIKQGGLENAFVTAQTNELLHEIATNEYGITESVVIERAQYKQVRSQLDSLIDLQILLRFSQISFEKDTLLSLFEQKLLYPIIAMIVFYIGVTYIQAYEMQNRVDKLTKELEKVKEKTKPIKQAIVTYNEEIARYNQFATKELLTPNPFRILKKIYNTIGKKDKAALELVSIDGLHMQLRLSTDEDPIKYLNKLNKIPYFTNVIIQSTYKRRNKPKLIIYAIDLKTTQEIFNAD